MNYLKIDKEDVCNGEGLRVVLWLSGCSHKCKGCQNPQTWDANSGIPFDESAKEELFRELDKDYISGLTLTGGDPLFESNLDDVLNLVTEVNKRYNTPQDRVRVTDKNNNILTSLPNRIRLSFPQKSIWLYTGYTFEQCQPHTRREWFVKEYYPNDNELLTESINFDKRAEIIENINVLVDGRYIDSLKDITLSFRGSKNQRLIDVKKTLQKGDIILWAT